MKKSLYMFFFCVIFAAIVIIFFPAGELTYSFSMPYTEEQELTLAWDFSGRPAVSGDPDIQKTRRFISVEFFDYPGDEARFLIYAGSMHYEYKAGSAAGYGWDRLEMHFYPNYDTTGMTIDILL